MESEADSEEVDEISETASISHVGVGVTCLYLPLACRLSYSAMAATQIVMHPVHRYRKRNQTIFG